MLTMCVMCVCAVLHYKYVTPFYLEIHVFLCKYIIINMYSCNTHMIFMKISAIQAAKIMFTFTEGSVQRKFSYGATRPKFLFWGMMSVFDHRYFHTASLLGWPGNVFLHMYHNAVYWDSITMFVYMHEQWRVWYGYSSHIYFCSVK